MAKEVLMQRANVVLRVPEHAVDRYFAQGYSIINEAGEVVQACVPQDIGTLQKAYIEKSDEIEALQNKIEELTTQLANANSHSDMPAKTQKRQTK